MDHDNYGDDIVVVFSMKFSYFSSIVADYLGKGIIFRFNPAIRIHFKVVAILQITTIYESDKWLKLWQVALYNLINVHMKMSSIKDSRSHHINNMDA